MRILVLAFIFLINVINIAKSQAYNIDSLLIESRNPDVGKRIDAMIMLSFAYINSRPDTALLLAEQVMEMSKARKYVRGELSAINNMAYVFSNMGQKERSLSLFLEGLKKSEKENYLPMQFVFTRNIGNFYLDNNDPAMALRYFFNALSFAKNRYPEKQGVIYSSLASAYIELNNLDSSRYYTSQAVQAIVSHPDEEIIASLYGLQGVIEERLGNIQVALQYYKLSMAQNEKDLFFPTAAENSLQIAKLYQRLGFKDSTIWYARRAHSFALISSSADEQLNSGAFLYKYHEDQGSNDSAYHYLRIVNVIKDTLFARERARSVQELGFGERIRQQEISLRTLEAKAERRSNLQLAAIAIFIPTFFLLVIVISRRRLNASWIDYLGIVALLLLFEFINLLLHPYIVRLTNHNNIFMLLILVALAALLVPAHHRLDHWLKEYLRKRKDRVKVKNAISDEESKSKKAMSTEEVN